MNKAPTICFIGESMLELTEGGQDQLNKSYAGDMFNSAVYLKRCFPEVKVSMMTVIGHEPLSQQMLAKFQHEQLNTDFVFQRADKCLGIYYIETDAQGERNFHYWRQDSAARTLVDFLDDAIVDQLKSYDMVCFSGISLAILAPTPRAAFLEDIKHLKQAGVKIVFDPNFRERLWENDPHVMSSFESAYQLADIILCGIEDMADLHQLDDQRQILDYLVQYDSPELIIKNGDQETVTYHQGELRYHPTPCVEAQLICDTTSAGDSFNGAYLGARLLQAGVEESVSIATQVAGKVICYKGALIPEQVLVDFRQQLTWASAN